MKITEQGNKSLIPARSSSRVEVENEASLAMIAETEVKAATYRLGESTDNVTKAPQGTVNDFDYALEEAARTLRNEVEAIASLAERDEAASRILEDDRPMLPRRDEPLDAEIGLLISGIEEELAVMSVLADTLAARLRWIAGERGSKAQGRLDERSRSLSERR
jgi:hypothetical protein